jgi:uncharacterized membrane protein YfcA
MVGLGGGFVLVPILRLVFGLEPAEAAGTSLALVVANSASGAFTYFLQKRVHVKIGLLLALGGLPGSILGAVVAARIPAIAFDWIFAALLLAVTVDIYVNRKSRLAGRVDIADIGAIKGMSYRVAVLVGLGVGFISSLFGVGGGVVVIPSLLYLSQLPAHAIAATSHFAIFLTSPVGLATHAIQHDIALADVIPLVLGGLLGGPIGARLSLRVSGPRLMSLVSIALVVAAAALILRHVF